MDVRFDSAEGALKYCKKLAWEGKATLFRGQTRDWPKLLPSLFRPNRDIVQSKQELDAFVEWARSVPQMAGYQGSDEAITAIAQHYGVPTSYLDLTSSPEIAFLFAKADSNNEQETGQAVIYCFSEYNLRQLTAVKVLRIDVANLWRLESQRGVFLEYLEPGVCDSVRELAIKLHFPREQLTDEESLCLYPTRKSALETVIDQWMYRHGIESILGRFSGKQILTKRYSYPGAFRWRLVPEYEPEWISGDERWLVPPIESVSVVDSSETVAIPRFDASDPRKGRDTVSKIISDSVKKYRHSNRLVTFSIELSPEKQVLGRSVASIINRAWDGLRVLPFTDNEVVNSISLSIALLCGRAEGVEGIDDWPKRIWGEVELVDIAPAGGHLEAAYVSVFSLRQALSSDHLHKLTKWMRRAAESDPMSVMTYVVDPWVLFEFGAFKKMFVEQFIPSAIDGFWKEDLRLSEGKLECMWSLSFNPALLGFVTRADYRFHSPIALETDVARTIYITPTMDRDDIEEAFASCVPMILGNSLPFEVKFTDYSGDQRELWEIDRVVEQTRYIMDIGGISVLEPFTSVSDERGRSIRGGREIVPQPGMKVGLGAFEVWLIATGQIQQVRGTSLPTDSKLFKRFWSEVLAANPRIDKLACSMPDWPGPTVEELG